MKKYQVYIEEAIVHATVIMKEIPDDMDMSEEEIKAAAVEALHAALPEGATVLTAHGDVDVWLEPDYEANVANAVLEEPDF